jgi:DNA modification methylase
VERLGRSLARQPGSKDNSPENALDASVVVIVAVLDAFLGSGTTVIAAERTGRRCYGLELGPVYVDTIVRRWQRLTGGSARHAASGRSFDDLARQAEAANAA